MDQRELEEFYYRWHKLEAANGVEIIDSDLLAERDAHPGPYRDRSEVKTVLDGLIHRAGTDPAVTPFIKAKLTACDRYLRALQGERFDFRDYIEATVGVRPHPIPDGFLREKLETVKKLFRDCGYDYTADDYRAFVAATRYPDAATIKTRFQGFERRVVPAVLSWLGLDFQLDYDVDFVEKDAYWLNWLGTDERARLKLQFNMHERKRSQWQDSVEEIMVFHEICGHVVQNLAWQQSAREGRIPRSCALTSVFSPETFSMEGIAQTLFDFFPDPPLSTIGKFFAERSVLVQMALSNAHIMANDGLPAEEIRDYLLPYQPAVDLDALKRTLPENTKHPLFRTYLYVYGISAYYHRLLAARLDDAGKRRFVLECYRNILMPSEIIAKAAGGS